MNEAFNKKAEELHNQLMQLQRAVTCAERIRQLPDDPEHGITFESRMKAISDVLKVGVARSDGNDATVSGETMLVMRRLLADVEVRLLWDKLGLKEWRPA